MKFCFLDGVVSSSLEGEEKVVTHVTFPQSEDYLTTPFHKAAQVPSTIVLEAVAASGGRLIELVSGSRSVGLMIKIDEASFIAPVCAGERMLVHSELLGMQHPDGLKVGLARTRGQAFVGDRPVAEARIAFLCLPMKRSK
jgi:3-hydroxymyristoyl/3-hydroxydecanoyl-(acyl carrier protein) dehydratase